MTNMANRRQSGVTLVELLVTVGIVAILSAIAYPSYQRYVARTHRNAASACLSQYAQVMEQHYTANLSYEGAPPAPPTNRAEPCSGQNELNRRYTIAVRAESVTESAYILDAIPIGTQAAVDAQCGTLTLDQSGERSTSVAANRDICWR
jgi:type IV pilus assembly protein PilE